MFERGSRVEREDVAIHLLDDDPGGCRAVLTMFGAVCSRWTSTTPSSRYSRRRQRWIDGAQGSSERVTSESLG